MYKGTFASGKPHGQGTAKYANGGMYEGMFRNGEPHGQGKFEYPDGRVYEGMFVKGTRYGHGKMQITHVGETYEGMFLNGKPHGKGKFVYGNGDVYEGMFVNGQRQGEGNYKHSDGAMYEGMFRDEKPHGQGKIEYPNGEMYEGMFVSGKRHGWGKYTYLDGQISDGLWVDGEPYGFNVFFTPEGTYYKVFYTNESSKLEVTEADRIVTTIQAHARGFLERKLAKRMREEQNILITADDAMQTHLKELERKERRNGIPTSKKPTPNTNARVPQPAGRARRGGGRTRNKRQQRESAIQEQDDKIPWSDEVRQGQLKKQMDRERHERAKVANTKASTIAPSYLDVLDLHEHTKVQAKEKLREKICDLKPLKNCNHLMVITGKGQHGEYACIKRHVRQLLDGAWHATYVVKRAGDGEGTDGFYVKITKQLKRHVKNAKDSQVSPTRPTVVVSPRVVHPGN